MKDYKKTRIKGESRRDHVRIAEAALGYRLPPGAQVHHVNEDKWDNRNENLVIIPSQSYHAFLHQRMRAFAACGHADWLKCRVCKQYDDPANLKIYTLKNYKPRIFIHSKCNVAWVKLHGKPRRKKVQP